MERSAQSRLPVSDQLWNNQKHCCANYSEIYSIFTFVNKLYFLPNNQGVGVDAEREREIKKNLSTNELLVVTYMSMRYEIGYHLIHIKKLIVGVCFLFGGGSFGLSDF